MDTESLKLFVLAAQKLNISAAGKTLGMAPAVASARIAKLEKTVGADLLRRSTRKVALSMEGEEFLPYAKEILAQENAAYAALGKENSTPSGTLRFAASSTFAQLYIIPILPEFMERYPDISLDLKLSDSKFDLIEGSFDLSLRNGALPDSSLKGRKLADDPRIVCAAPSYLEKHGIPRSPGELTQHKLISFNSDSPRELVGKDGSTALFAPKASTCHLVVDDGLSQKLATVAGIGVSVNSYWSVYSEIQNGSLVRILPDYEADIQTALWLVYPKSNVLTAKVRVFIDFLVEKIGSAPIWLS